MVAVDYPHLGHSAPIPATSGTGFGRSGGRSNGVSYPKGGNANKLMRRGDNNLLLITVFRIVSETGVNRC